MSAPEEVRVMAGWSTRANPSSVPRSWPLPAASTISRNSAGCSVQRGSVIGPTEH